MEYTEHCKDERVDAVEEIQMCVRRRLNQMWKDAKEKGKREGER